MPIPDKPRSSKQKYRLIGQGTPSVLRTLREHLMANHKTKLELTWIGKDNRPRLEPRILMEDPESPITRPRVTDHDIFDNRLISATTYSR